MEFVAILIVAAAVFGVCCFAARRSTIPVLLCD